MRAASGCVYVAFVLNVFSRMIVGWQTSRRMYTDLALDALRMGRWNRRRTGHDTAGLAHHSDRGVQVFGGSAMLMDMNQGTAIGEVAVENVNTAFFGLLDQLPLALLTSVIAIVLVVLYFDTGADSNVYVLAVISNDGDTYPKRSVLGVWGILTGAMAAVLLYAGGLQTLQTALILSAAPFIFVILALAIVIVMLLRRDAPISHLHPGRHCATADPSDTEHRCQEQDVVHDRVEPFDHQPSDGGSHLAEEKEAPLTGAETR